MKQTTTQQPRVRLIQGEELAQLAKAMSNRELVEGLPIADTGVTTLAGDPYVGKSTLLANLATDVALGKSDLGNVRAHGSVCVMSREHGSWSFASKLVRAATGRLTRIEDLPISLLDAENWSIDDDELVCETRTLLDENAVKLFVVDTLRDVTASDENASAEMQIAYRRLETLAERRAVVVVHHLGKNGRLRGSTAIPASSGSTVLMRRDGNCFRLSVEHHDRANSECRIRIEQTDISIKCSLADGRPPSSQSNEADIKNAITAILRDCPDSFRGIARRLRESRGSAPRISALQTIISSLSEQGSIKRDNGRWVLS